MTNQDLTGTPALLPAMGTYHDNTLEERTLDFQESAINPQATQSDLLQFLRARLQTGEAIIWFGQPQPEHAYRLWKQGGIISVLTFIGILMVFVGPICRFIVQPLLSLSDAVFWSLSLSVSLVLSVLVCAWANKTTKIIVSNTLYVVTSKRAIRLRASDPKKGWTRHLESFAPKDISLADMYQTFQPGHVYKLPFFLRWQQGVDMENSRDEWIGFEALSKEQVEAAISALRELKALYPEEMNKYKPPVVALEQDR